MKLFMTSNYSQYTMIQNTPRSKLCKASNCPIIIKIYVSIQNMYSIQNIYLFKICKYSKYVSIQNMYIIQNM